MMREIKHKIRYTLTGSIGPILTRVTKHYTHTITYGGIALKVKGGFEFRRVSRRFTPEERFLSNLDLKGKTIYDIGCHIGILTIFFAKSAGKTGKIIAFEPNPETYIRIQKNVELNDLDNVEILNIGIGDKRETRMLVVHGDNSAKGSMEKNIQLQILNKKGAKSLQVEVDTLDGCIEANKLPKPDFIKIDIEGMEYNALLGMAETISKYKPSMCIEIHGADKESAIKNVQRIVKFLDLHGYSIYHVESEREVTDNNAQIAKEGHIFCK